MTERLSHGVLGPVATPLVIGWLAGMLAMIVPHGAKAEPPNLLPLPASAGWLPPVESPDLSESVGPAVPAVDRSAGGAGPTPASVPAADDSAGRAGPTRLVAQVRPLPPVEEPSVAYRQGRADSQSVPPEPVADPPPAPRPASPGLRAPAPIPHPQLSAGDVHRSKPLEEAAKESDALTHHAFELAGRRAYFSARAEFADALRLLAQALDEDRDTRRHEAALAAGLTALREADDFLAGASRLEADVDMAAIVAGHRTTVLKETSVHGRVRQAGMSDTVRPIALPALVTPRAALQCYFTYAQEQLAESAGGELAGSMALYGLGKQHDYLAAREGETIRAARPKAVVFYQAALLVCPRNYMAANDLGVMLARGGRPEDARRMLEHSLSIQPHSAGWRNLAAVYRQLGRADLAQRAEQQSAAVAQAESARAGRRTPAASMVQWVDAAAFAQKPGEPAQVPLRAPAGRSPTAAMWPQGAMPTSAWACGSHGHEDVAMPPREIILCQALGPAAPCPICAVDCSTGKCNWSGRGGWEAARAIDWQAYAQGEYVGHARLAHVPEYRLRVDDQLDMVFRLTREETSRPYKLNVGDEIRVESFSDAALTRDLTIQPDGTITLRLLGQVHATGKTVPQLRDELEQLYLKFYKVPAITVTPIKANTKLEDLRATVDRRAGVGGQSQLVKVTPEGTVSLPAIGTVPAQGLTLPELQKELNQRYREQIEGMEIIPVLAQRAPRFVYVLGEVRTPGRYELSGPTTVIQAISMAGSWNVGGNLRQVVVFRRGDDWRLLATMVNLQAALYGNQPCPQGEIWLSDSDVVLVPKGQILKADEFINLVFTRGIYGVFPFSTQLSFSSLATL